MRSRRRKAPGRHVFVPTVDLSGPVAGVANLATHNVERSRSPPRTNGATQPPVFSRAKSSMLSTPSPAPLHTSANSQHAGDSTYKRRRACHHSKTGERAHVASQAAAHQHGDHNRIQHGDHNRISAVATGAAVGFSAAPTFAEVVSSSEWASLL